MEKSVINGLLLILIDLFNLAEQFGIYFITKERSLDESDEQQFFLILFGIGGATLIRPMFLWSKLQVVFSMLIEVGEFIAYLILLPRTPSLIAVASVFFACELLFHLISLYATESNKSDIDANVCFRECCFFQFEFFCMGLCTPHLWCFSFSILNRNFGTHSMKFFLFSTFSSVSVISI